MDGLKLCVLIVGKMKLNKNNFVDFRGSEIGLCAIILYKKEWGKVPVNGKLRSKFWWESRLDNLINSPTIIIPNFLDKIYSEMIMPIPYEVEYNMTNKSDCVAWFEYSNKNSI